MTKPYHKINTVFKRDRDAKNTIYNEWAHPALEMLADNENWVWTEKIDGCSLRVVWTGEKVLYKGRSENSNIPATLVERLQDLFPVDKMNDLFGSSPVTLYGEGFGAKIQKGGLYTMPEGTKVDFILFDVFVEPQWWLARNVIEGIADDLGIRVVPFLFEGDVLSAIRFMLSHRKSYTGSGPMEGLVGKLKYDLFDRSGERLVFKLKVRDFDSYIKYYGVPIQLGYNEVLTYGA